MSSSNAPNAFLTGSRKYGIPREDSDIDVCILTDDLALIEMIIEHSEESPTEDSYYSGRFGKLNIIVCRSELEFKAWKEGTELLYKTRPSSREQAMRVLDRIRIEKGVL